MGKRYRPNQSLSQLALDLWAALDTEISPPGCIDHAQALPVIKRWLAEHAPEIARLHETEVARG